MAQGIARPVGAQTGFLGLEIQSAEDARAIAALGSDFKGGVLVKDVAIGEPAAIAGFRRGDVIVEFNGAKTPKIDDLLKAVGRTKPGQKVSIVVMRADKRIELSLLTTERPPAWNVTTSLFNTYNDLGFTVVAITDAARKQFSLPWGTVGLLVTLVQPGSVVATGLHVGEVIVQANLRDVWDPRQLTRELEAARSAKKDGVLVLVRGKDGYRYSVIPVK